MNSNKSAEVLYHPSTWILIQGLLEIKNIQDANQCRRIAVHALSMWDNSRMKIDRQFLETDR